MTALMTKQIECYRRHLILKDVGVSGQKKLLNGKVLVIGADGLGAPALLYLAAVGVGTIGIADTVDLSMNVIFSGIQCTESDQRL